MTYLPLATGRVSALRPPATLVVTGRGAAVSPGGGTAAAGKAPAGGWLVRVGDDRAVGPDEPGQALANDTSGAPAASPARGPRDTVLPEAT